GADRSSRLAATAARGADRAAGSKRAADGGDAAGGGPDRRARGRGDGRARPTVRRDQRRDSGARERGDGGGGGQYWRTTAGPGLRAVRRADRGRRDQGAAVDKPGGDGDPAGRFGGRGAAGLHGRRDGGERGDDLLQRRERQVR